MNFFEHREWVMISSRRKIVHYPEFYYGANSDHKYEIFDSYNIENKIRTHLFRMKLLLLYFHHISIPFCNFYVCLDNISAHLYNALFKNYEFQELIANGYIIYELRSKYDALSYFERYEGELKKCGFNNTLPLNNDLRNIFNDLLVVERGNAHLTRSFGMQEAIENVVSKSSFHKNEVQSIKRVIDKSLSGGNAFMHEIFVYELHDLQFRHLHNTIANSYLKISETSNHNTLTYTPVNNPYFGSLLRRNISNNVYAFLYSPDFFEFFLSLFIDLKQEINIYELSLEKIKLIRSYEFWNDFVHEYHEIITQISAHLHSVTNDKLFLEAQKAMMNELKADRLQKSGLLLLKSLLVGVLSASKIPLSIEFLGEATNLNRTIPLLYLNRKYTATRDFLRLFSSLMRK